MNLDELEMCLERIKALKNQRDFGKADRLRNAVLWTFVEDATRWKADLESIKEYAAKILKMK